LREKAKRHHTMCKKGKTIGKSIRTSGRVLSVVAPFTGGMAFAIGVAAVSLSIFGDVVDKVADVIDEKQSRKVFSVIKSLVDNRKYADYPKTILKKYFENSIASLTSNRISEEDAVQISLKSTK
jgi:hypothetical protein